MSNDILIIEDHGYVADATKEWLVERLSSEARAGAVLVGRSVSEARELLNASQTRWRLILLDLDIPGAVGLSFAAHLKEIGLASITCVVTGHDRPDFVAQINEGGFLGYVLKASKTADFHAAMESVLEGRRTFQIDADKSERRRLTVRQAQIVAMVRQGMTSKEIGRLLDLRAGTVDNHITAACSALSAKTRSELMARALEFGLI